MPPPHGEAEISQNGHALPSATRKPKTTANPSARGLCKGQTRTFQPPGCPSFLPGGLARTHRGLRAGRSPVQGCGLQDAGPGRASLEPPRALALHELEHRDAALRSCLLFCRHTLLERAGWPPAGPKSKHTLALPFTAQPSRFLMAWLRMDGCT